MAPMVLTTTWRPTIWPRASSTPAHPTGNNLDQLRGYMHVRRMRWVRPEDVEVIP